GQAYPLVIPPASPRQKRDQWTSTSLALVNSVRDREIPTPLKSLAAIANAYSTGNAGEFNQSVAGYKDWLQQNDFTREIKKGRNEFFYNDTKAFLHALIIYLAAFVLAAISLLTLSTVPQFSESLRKSSFCLILLAGLVHTFGLIFRMWLEGRPP